MPRDSRSPNLTPAQAAAIYQRGLAAFEPLRYAEAVELLSAIGEMSNLTGTLARFYLGQAHTHCGAAELKAGRHATAARHFNTARTINPDSANLSRYLAACHAGNGRFDLAAAEIERVAAAENDNLQPIRLAHALAQDGRLPRAIETLVEVIDAEPHRVDVRLQLGLIYAAAEEFEDAICILQEAAELAPLLPEVRQHLGLALAAVGDHSEAIEHLAVAQKLKSHDAHLGLLLTLAVDAAKSTCVKLAITPATGRLDAVDDQSLEVLGELITQEPDFVESFLRLPSSDVDTEVFAMLAAILEQALENKPEYADLHYHCSRIYQRLGRSTEAIHKADEAIRINPRYVQALIQLGRLHAEADDADHAIERLAQAVECGGDYPDVHYLIGELCQRKGDADAARDAFHKALQLNTNYDRARQALETVTTADSEPGRPRPRSGGA